MPTYDIIIPHLGVTSILTELCRRCLRSIARHSADYRVILVDNGSPAFGEVEPDLRALPHLLVRNTVNMGFIHAVNYGIWLSSAPYIVLMNNDTEAAPGWLEKLRAPLDKGARIGLSGPRTTTPNSWQGRAPVAAGWRLLPKGHMLAFFCTMFRREVFDECGVLNEAYGAGLGDDDDFSRRAQRAGWGLALVQDLVIPHHHRTTFRTLYSESEIKGMQEAALARFHAGV